MTARRSLFSLAAILSASWALAADVIPDASQRFAKEDAAEVPEFRRHIVPLLGKLGCNGRACHGSFQGQGGFRLSLFGYDFKMDHEGLKERLDVDAPADSYALQKPTLIEPHEGGKRLDVGSWEYRMLLNWIKDGAKPYDAATHADFVQLHVEPQEIQFRNKGESAQLNVVVEWTDGTREDVTKLCRFQSNNEQVATIDRNGLVVSNDVGDTHVVVFFDNGVMPIPVLRPVTDLIGPKYPQVATPTKIDELVAHKLSKLGIVPSGICGDAEFLRRVSLDITGTLPTESEVREFIADGSPDKRSQKIDELLERPGYAAWWTTKLCDFTGNNDNVMNNIFFERDTPAKYWYNWIHARVANNTPYDKLVEGIVVANSREEGESFRDFTQAMATIYSGDQQQFAERSSMPFFWARQNVRQPTEKALAFAYSFMGVRIQCAECHKHPFDQWTQEDYNEFTKFFTRVQFSNRRDLDAYNALVKELGVEGRNGNDQRNQFNRLAREGKAVPLSEVFVAPLSSNNRRQTPNRNNRNNNNRTSIVTAKLLGDEVVNLSEVPDPRSALMDWLREQDNPYFAKAFVNRVWANYFNVGIVEPPDDLNLANPPSNAALLDWLAEEFIARGFDMKWLHREICNSAAYQRGWDPNETNRLDERNFSRAVPRRLPAEVAVDVLAQATLSDAKNAEMVHKLDGRAIARTTLRGGNNAFALDVFGTSTRESNCDCDRSMEASLLQTIYIRNDADLDRLLSSRDGWVQQIVAELNPRAAVRDDDNSRGSRELRELVRQYDLQETRLAELKQRQPDNPRIKQLEERQDQMKKQIDRLRKANAPNDPPATETADKPKFDAENLVTRAYLRTLSRYPNSEELTSASTFLNESKDLGTGLKDLMWALLNTKEFIVNH